MFNKSFATASRLALTAALAFIAVGGGAVVEAQDKRVGQVISADPKLSTLNKAIEAAGLAESLSGGQALTVLAPTDEAFAKLPAGTVEDLLKPENKDKLAALLKRHIVVGRLTQDDIKKERDLTSVGGDKLPVKLVNGRLRVADARVLGKEVVATNGVVQTVEEVIVK
jgi:uncharacterized surface protein with fasciclin (FAS1) repeats